jgi:hypothetical protein
MRLPALAAPARRERLFSRWREASHDLLGQAWSQARRLSSEPPPKEEGRRFGQISKPCSPRSAPVPGCTCRPLKTTTAESARP